MLRYFKINSITTKFQKIMTILSYNIKKVDIRYI